MDKFEESVKELDFNNDEPSIHEILEPSSMIRRGISPIYEKPLVPTNGVKPLSHRDNNRLAKSSGVQEKEPRALLISQSTARMSQCFSSIWFE